jgi:hypothetical protein
MSRLETLSQIHRRAAALTVIGAHRQVLGGAVHVGSIRNDQLWPMPSTTMLLVPGWRTGEKSAARTRSPESGSSTASPSRPRKTALPHHRSRRTGQPPRRRRPSRPSARRGDIRPERILAQLLVVAPVPDVDCHQALADGSRSCNTVRRFCPVALRFDRLQQPGNTVTSLTPSTTESHRACGLTRHPPAPKINRIPCAFTPCSRLPPSRHC